MPTILPYLWSMSFRVLCALLLPLSLFAEGLKIVTRDGYQGVEDDKGQVIIPAVYETLGWSDGGFDIVRETIGYRENGRWGLINIRSKKVTGARYEVLRPFTDDFFEAGVRGQFSNRIFRGLITRDGQTHFSFNYLTLELLARNLVMVSDFQDGQFLYGVRSLANEPVLPLSFISVYTENNLLLATNGLHKIHVFSANGTPLLPHPVDACDWDGQRYTLKNDGKYGQLSPEGKLQTPIAFKSLSATGHTAFPVWEIRSISGGKGLQMACDSLTYSDKGQLFIAHVNDASHLLTVSTQLFSDQQHRLVHVGHGFVVTQNTSLATWGIYRTDGRTVTEGHSAVQVDSAYFYVKDREGWQIWNLFGRKLTTQPVQAVGPSQDRNIPVRRGDYWGWLDFQGGQLVDQKFEAVDHGAVHNQFRARYLRLWGVSTFEEDWIVMPRYDTIEVSSAGFYVARKQAATLVFDAQGRQLIATGGRVWEQNRILYLQDENRLGLITHAGHVVWPAYDSLKRIGNFYVLYANGSTRLIDSEGREILKPADGVSEVLAFSEGYFMMIKDGKYGFVDLNGRLRIANRYDDALPFHEGLASVKLLGRWGFIDPSETLVIQPYYQHAATFSQNLCVIQTNDRFGIISQEGEEIVQSAWKHIERLPTGNYRLTDWDGKQGLVNAEGRIVLQPSFELLQDTEAQLVIATQNGRQGVLDYQGNLKVPFEYAEIQIAADYLLLRKD